MSQLLTSAEQSWGGGGGGGGGGEVEERGRIEERMRDQGRNVLVLFVIPSLWLHLSCPSYHILPQFLYPTCCPLFLSHPHLPLPFPLTPLPLPSPLPLSPPSLQALLPALRLKHSASVPSQVWTRSVSSLLVVLQTSLPSLLLQGV